MLFQFIFLLIGYTFNNIRSVLPYGHEQVHISLNNKVDSMIISWVTFFNLSTNENCPVVEYGLDEQLLLRRQNGTTKSYKNGTIIRFFHKVVLTNLTSNTKYYYRVGNNETWSRTFHFKTFPSGSNFSFNLCAFGDMDTEKNYTLNSLIKSVKNNECNIIIHVGDIAYDLHNNNGMVGDQFMREIESVAAYVPYMVVPGNHEFDCHGFLHYNLRFNMPYDSDACNQEDHFYYFNVGPVHFIGLSSEVYGFYTVYGKLPIIKQGRWLKNKLETIQKNRKEKPWIIAYLHRPIYIFRDNNGTEVNDHEYTLIRKGYRDIPGLGDYFDKYKVDLVLSGHEHMYERNYPVLNRTVYQYSNVYYINPPGTTYIVTGAGGCVRCSYVTENMTNTKDYPFSAKRSTEIGYTFINIKNHTHLRGQQIGTKKGNIIDDFWIVKGINESTNDKKVIGRMATNFVSNSIKKDTNSVSKSTMNNTAPVSKSVMKDENKGLKTEKNDVLEVRKKKGIFTLRNIIDAVLVSIILMLVVVLISRVLTEDSGVKKAKISIKHTHEQVHLSLGKDDNSMVITWLTLTNLEDSSLVPMVKYGTKESELIFEVNGTTKSFFNSSSKIERFVHKAELKNLKHDTKYFYQVGDSVSWSKVFNFINIDRKKNVKACFIGDMDSTVKYTRLALQNQVRNRRCDIIIHVGDIAYHLSDQQGTVGDQYMKDIEIFAAYAPYMVISGNAEFKNDNYKHYNYIFNMPYDKAHIIEDDHFYKFTFGNVNYFGIQSQVYMKDGYNNNIIIRQFRWLNSKLKKVEKNSWIIVYFHHPMYCCTTCHEECENGIYKNLKDGNELINDGIEETLKKRKVDLIINGHVHGYVRGYPVFKSVMKLQNNDSYFKGEAPTQIITGVGGSQKLPPDKKILKNENFPFAAKKSLHFGFTRIEATNEKEIKIEYISSIHGNTLDSFTIKKK
uniref:Purple acid phosphatase n=1 Tax=Parastrongyloides trichosuri TaxID=131310 RepID=A0A0N4ZK86_PARTI